MSSFFAILFLIAVVGIIIFSWCYNSPQQKGRRGEAKVNNIISQLPQGYHMLNDVILKTRNGTTQIDHIVVSKYGVFTIETKNYRGDIYGDDNRDKWTQIIVTDVTYMKKWYKTYTYVTKNHLYNPVKQSIGHANVIRRTLSEWRNLKVVPIVAFSGRANLSNVRTNNHVVYIDELFSVIQNYRTECLSDSDVQGIINRLTEKNVRGIVDDKTHAQNVYAARNERNRKLAAGICPKCGGNLVQRNGRYGSFYGCSNYPRCRFTTH